MEIDYDPPNNDINNNSSKYDKEITRNSLESYSNNDNISHNDNNSNSENENDIVNSNNTTKEKEEFKTLFLNSIENLIKNIILNCNYILNREIKVCEDINKNKNNNINIK